MSTHNFIIIILNTLMFSMLFHLCKFATACHSLKNVDENQPIKKNHLFAEPNRSQLRFGTYAYTWSSSDN